MLKTKYLVIFLAFLVLGMTVAVAADVDDSTSTTKKVTKDTTKIVKNTAVTKKATKTTDKKTTKAKENTKTKNTTEKTITKNTQTKSVKRGEIREVNNTSFDQLFTVNGLGSIVNPGDTLNFVDNITRNGSYVVDKSVTIQGNGNRIELNTVSGDYNGTESGNSFNITGSYINITNLKFYNTQVFVKTADHVIMDNINVTVKNQRIGSGVGVTSIRENSSYITVKNSFFNTVNNEGSSTLVLASADYCTVDNNTIIGEGYVGNLMYLTTYNIPGVNYTDVNVNTFNNITNNRISAINLTGGVCVGVVVSGHNNTFEGNNVSVPSAFNGQWISPFANQTGDFNDTYEGNSYINNDIYGSFTGTKNSTIMGNKFNKTVSLPERCIFKNNNAENFTVTIKGSNCDLCGNRIYHLTVNSGVTNTRVCRDNVFINGYDGSFTWYTHPTSLGLLNKKSIQQVKTEGEPTVITITEENYAEWFKLDDEKRLKFVSGSNGAKTFYIEYLPTNITMLDLYNWYSTSWDTSQYTFIGKNNFNLTNVKLRAWGANVLISNMTLYYDEDYENSGDSFSYYIFIESDYDYVPGSSFVLDNIKINYTGKYLENYHAGVLCTGENQPGVTYQNFEINAKMLSVPDGNELIILERNDKFINSTVNIVENYATADETSITGIKVNSKSVTIKDNNITLTGESTLTAIKLNSNNNTITNNNITVTTTGTANGVELTGNDNTVTDNYIVANDKYGNNAVTTTGENNLIQDNTGLIDTGVTVINPNVVNVNEISPMTVILKDANGNLLANQEINVTVGDEFETITTDASGIAVYDFLPTTSGSADIVFNYLGGGKFLSSNKTVTVTVNEDKDAIIEELNKTIQEQKETIASQEEDIEDLNNIINEQDDEIESLTNTTQALNNTIAQLEQDLTQAQEQLANNNNTNTNGTSNTNTTTPTKTSVTLKLKPTTIYTGSKTKITATLKDANGKAVASQKISIKVGTKTYTVKTNNKGVATKTVKVTKTGKNKITATFKATNKYAKATKTSTLTVKAKQKTKITVTKLSYKNKKITIKATIKAGKKALTQNTKLTIKVDGKTLTAKKTSKKGKISLTLKKTLKTGSHKIQIISKATSMYKQAKVTKTLKV